MEFLTVLKDRVPDYAKDIRLNLDSVLGRSS
ncbi:MAG: carboxymuconolactone decarboxylase family protein, partial [Burkholderiales bacterium]|nr:carboxymuconolactone decarboxylase family protein [Burkholderiales bacterium]